MKTSASDIVLGLVLLLCTSHLYGSSMVVSHVSASPGDTAVMIPVILDNTNPYAGFEIGLDYNPSLLTLNRIESAARLSNQSETGYYEFAAGKISLIVFDIMGNTLPADSGDIFHIYFDVAPEPTEDIADVAIYDMTAVDDNLEYDTITSTDGYIRILGEYAYGDANSDGSVDISDALFIIHYIFKGGPAPDPIEAGDPNGDCDINIADAIYIIHYVFKDGPPPVAGCSATLKSNPPRNLAEVRFDLADPDASDGVLVYGVNVENDCDIAGAQIVLNHAIEGVECITTTSTKRTEKLQLIEDENQKPYAFGLIDLRGDEVIAAGTGEIAYIHIKVSENYRGKHLVNLQKIVFVDTEGRVMKLDVQGIDQDRPIPRFYSLSQNYPNPFNPMTRVDYTLPRSAHVKLTIYNVLGQTVRVLVDADQEPGEYSVTWDSKDGGCSVVASGVYFYQISAGNFIKSKKMLLLK